MSATASHLRENPYEIAKEQLRRVGERACPFTTLYWNFLIEHEALLAKNPRTVMQVKNLARVDASTRAAITAQAKAIRGGTAVSS